MFALNKGYRAAAKSAALQQNPGARIGLLSSAQALKHTGSDAARKCAPSRFSPLRREM
jgi:hypothetical protein